MSNALKEAIVAATSRLAELQEEVVKLRGVEAQAVEWFNKAEEGYRIVQALQEELDVARATIKRQLVWATAGMHGKAEDDRINADKLVGYDQLVADLEAKNATLTERAALADEWFGRRAYVEGSEEHMDVGVALDEDGAFCSFGCSATGARVINRQHDETCILARYDALAATPPAVEKAT